LKEVSGSRLPRKEKRGLHRKWGIKLADSSGAEIARKRKRSYPARHSKAGFGVGRKVAASREKEKEPVKRVPWRTEAGILPYKVSRPEKLGRCRGTTIQQYIKREVIVTFENEDELGGGGGRMERAIRRDAEKKATVGQQQPKHVGSENNVQIGRGVSTGWKGQKG